MAFQRAGEPGTAEPGTAELGTAELGTAELASAGAATAAAGGATGAAVPGAAAGVGRRGGPRWRRWRADPAVLSGVGMVLAGAVSVQAGGAVVVRLFARMSPAGIASVRLTVAALILLAVCRPAIRSLGRGDWTLLILFGVAVASMLGLMYQAIDRIPVGAAVTLEVLGPLALAVGTARRAASWLWAGLAAGGVALLGRSGFAQLEPAGVAYALLAGAIWAGYIRLSARAARRFPKAHGVAVAMAVAAAVSLPIGVVSAGGAMLNLTTLGLVALVAALSTVVPYTLDNLALRSVPESSFGILMSLDPALAAAAGFVILGQRLGLAGTLAIVLVMIASAGAVLTPPRGAA
jgi:inner membrane transporter RhtA